MLRLKTRAQFQAVLASRAIAKSEHFALHRHPLDEGASQPDARARESAANTAVSVPLSSATSTRPDSVRPQAALFSPPDLWIGAMVPKRWAKRSVTRHAIKRQIYGVADLLLPQEQAAYLVRLRSGFSRQQFLSSSSDVLKQAVRTELMGLMAGLSRPAAAP